MATATFFNTSKRHNSTLVPSAGGVDIEVKLKGGADLNAPSFVLSSTTIPNYSMMLFEGKYYFINKVRNVRDQLFEIDCTVDVLATYKANIQAMNAYVLYYNHSNTEITDRRLSVKTTQSTQAASANFDSLGSVDGSHCAYILTVTGKDSTAEYALSGDSVNSILGHSFFDAMDDNIDDIVPVQGTGWDAFVDSFRWFADLIKTEIGSWMYAGKAGENIRNCFILPISVSSAGGYDQHIYAGRMDTGVSGLRIVDRIFSDSATVNIPWQATDWRRNAPYHTIYLFIPFIGMTTIPACEVIGESTITVRVSLDKFSGDTIFIVETATKKIAEYTTNLASSYPIGSSNISPSGAMTALGSFITAASTGSPLALATTALGITNQLDSIPTSIGSNGGAAALGLNGNKIYCFTVFHDTTVSPHNPADVLGEPYNGVLSLANISGYVQTSNASVSGSMTDDERTEINNLLDGGVYIE